MVVVRNEIRERQVARQEVPKRMISKVVNDPQVRGVAQGVGVGDVIVRSGTRYQVSKL